MTDTVVLVCGVQGSGKSWICRQLTSQFEYVPHDQCWKHPIAKPKNQIDAKWGPPGCVSTHFETIVKRAEDADRPVITEVPFAEKKLKEDLEAEGLTVMPVFVIEDTATLRKRYFGRERKHLNKSAVTRAEGLPERAAEWDAFAGTSAEVLDHLKHLKGKPAAHKSQFALHR